MFRNKHNTYSDKEINTMASILQNSSGRELCLSLLGFRSLSVTRRDARDILETIK